MRRAILLALVLCGCPDDPPPTATPSAAGPTPTREAPSLWPIPEGSHTPMPTPQAYCVLLPDARCCRNPFIDCPE